ncbi:NAD-dependent epimerase/dehydratase family protein [Ramlibacter sp.]|uniref:NAD-dependent epimerase/dehydratase family protein n=1 Tax=Ramlibacter sp. TaxID=1917967 RepID=UPI0017B3D6D3|nr:NAD-dependent epimerase/dehydratase family protein [Ramlibacter sp.]MBA2674029.1 NAD-dependent epimerase/dehydratase family protein [Ramlibacter sp.]
MPTRVLVIGGTRFFGKRLVRGLLEQGCDLTLATRGRAADDFGDTVRRIRVDRRDAAAMRAAFDGARYDVVYDQMCYSPLDAAISAEVFAGKVGRYVMSSTIEVYRGLPLPGGQPFTEADLALDRVEVDHAYPWHAPEFSEVSYGRGKRQAEAFLQQDDRLPFTSVRIGHVLSGPDDFTGRLREYVERVLQGRALWHAAVPGASSFTSPAGIVAFLLWVAQAPLLGPVNAADDGVLTSVDIHRRVCALAGRPEQLRPVRSEVTPSELSPFDYPAPYAMDTARAQAAGHYFGNTADWLDGFIVQHLEALRAQAASAPAT